MRGLLMMCAVGFAACIQSGAAVCPDGKVCAEGTTCRVVSGARGQADEVCATASQMTVCKDQPDRHRCGPTSHCFDGVCLPRECGNGRLDKDPDDQDDSSEVCDDGNQIDRDGCSAHCDSNEQCGNGVLDSLVGETCDDGNLVQHDGCDSKCKTEDPRWQLLTSAPAIGRTSGAMAYDAARGRVVLFGGFDHESGVPLNDTWEWDGQAWLLLDPATRPAPRSGHAMVYDAARHAVVLFGGESDDNQVFQDTWEWDGDTWIPLAAQRSPTARVGFGMVYDAGRQRIVLFGGVSTAEPVLRVLSDTWEWDGTTWTPIAMTPGASLPGVVGAMAYDPERGRTVLFGGGQVTETWEYAGHTHQWTQVAATGPTPRPGSAMTYDLANQRILMFGGSGDDAMPLDETWAYDGTQWTPVPASAIGKAAFMMASDVARRRVVIFGGKRDDSTWEWDGASWIATAQVRQLPQAGPVVAYDPERARTTLVGSVFSADPPQRMFDYDGLGLVSIDPPDLPGFVHPAMTFDPGHRAVMVFDADSQATWLWDGTRWTAARPALTPPALVGAAMAYDHKNGRVLLFGGGGPLPQAETWGWSGTNWSMVATAHAPSARSNASIGWDPIRQQIVLFGGTAADGSRRGDTWVWDGSDWIERTPMMSPEPRDTANMAWNASRGRLVLFGGSDLGPLFDTWEWNGAAWEQLAIGNGPTGRIGAAMFPASDGSGVFAFGGSVGTGLGGHAVPELWRLRWMGSHTSESCLDNLDLDLDGLKGCDDPDCWSVCRPSEPPGAPPAPLAPHCGDGVCNQALENCRICPQDCTCTPVCGDYFCDPPEDRASCPGDCGP